MGATARPSTFQRVTTQLSHPEGAPGGVDGSSLQEKPGHLTAAWVGAWLEELLPKAGSGDLPGLQARLWDFQEHLRTSHGPE